MSQRSGDVGGIFAQRGLAGGLRTALNFESLVSGVVQDLKS
jgi:hypothetical protein